MSLLSKKTLGIISVLIAALLWSASGLLVKSIDANPVFIVFGRSLVAAVLLFPAIKFKKLKFNKNLIILGLAYTSCLTSFVVSTKLTAAANAITLQYTAPFFLFIGLWIFKNEFNKSKLVPMIIILLGIIAFLLEPANGSNVFGNLLAIFSGISFAVVIYYIGFDYGLSGMGLTALLSLFTLPVVAIIVPWTKQPWPVDYISIILIVVLGVFQIGLAYTFFNYGRKHIPALDASIILLIEPVLNPIWVFIFIGEQPTIYAIIGMILIILAQVVNAAAENRQMIRSKISKN